MGNMWLLILQFSCSSTEKDTCDDSLDSCQDEESHDSGRQESSDTDTGEEPETEEPEDTGTPQEEEEPATSPCEGIAICDDFEGYSTGAIPAAQWSIETPNCSGLGEAMVADDHARSGNNSIKILGTGGYCDHIFIAPTADVASIGPQFYGRFWMHIENAFGWEHITFLAMKDEVEGKDLRMGGQSQIMMWNRESDDATLPELSPTGISLSHAPVPQTWMCVSFHIDEVAGTIETWIDGEPIAGLLQDGMATPDVDRQWVEQKPDWVPSLIDIKLGWESYGGSNNTIWYDDVAFSSSPLSCE